MLIFIISTHSAPALINTYVYVLGAVLKCCGNSSKCTFSASNSKSPIIYPRNTISRAKAGLVSIKLEAFNMIGKYYFFLLDFDFTGSGWNVEGKNPLCK